MFVIVNRQWKVKDGDQCIAVIEAWVYLIPEWVLANILDQLIMPKLQVIKPCLTIIILLW